MAANNTKAPAGRTERAKKASGEKDGGIPENGRSDTHPARERFRKFAHTVSNATGTPAAFIIAFFVILFWGASGPIFKFSDTWQLVINTGTTIITFLMVFLIQNTQNRDSQAIHAKLDELLIATKGAHNQLAMAEDLSDEDLAHLKLHFEKLAELGHAVDEEIEDTEDLIEDREEAQSNSNATRRSSAGSK